MPKKAEPRKGRVARLVIENGPRGGTVFPLILQETLVGRIDSAQLILEDSTVSRLHARLVLKDDEVFVIDLDSREGTWVNGVAVHSSRLQEGDRLSFGDEVVEFQRS